MSKTISVIIPTYNYAAHLPATLESVLAQEVDGADIEIVVIDDGSTDDTPDLLKRYASRVHAVRQENKGLSAARNRGMNEADGDLLLFLDSDDLLAENCLNGQMEFLAHSADCDVAVCLNDQFTHLERGKPVVTGSWNLFRDALDIHLCHFNIAPPHAFLVKRERFADFRFDEELMACEDHWFWLSLLVAGARFKANPASLVYYRRHPESMSANESRQQRHNALIHQRTYDVLERADRDDLIGLRYLACLAGAAWTYRVVADSDNGSEVDLAGVATACLEKVSEFGFQYSDIAEWFGSRLRMAVSNMADKSFARTLENRLDVLFGPAPKGEDLQLKTMSLQQRLQVKRS